jgi:hypothetical protein
VESIEKAYSLLNLQYLLYRSNEKISINNVLVKHFM